MRRLSAAPSRRAHTITDNQTCGAPGAPDGVAQEKDRISMLRPLRRGEGHIKLTEEEVAIIKRDQGKVKRKTLAEKFGVDPSTISKIWYGQAWGHVEPAE